MLLSCGFGEDLRVPWTARRPNQSILKEISPDYSLEGPMLKMKLILWLPDAKNWLIGERPRCWESLKAGGEGVDRGWDGWMASLTEWTWIWASSGSWWWTGKADVLRCMGLQRVKHNWVTELNWVLKQQTYFSQFWRRRESEIMVRFLVKTFLIYRWPSFPRWHSGKESTSQSRRLRFSPWIGQIPWRRKWQPTPVFLHGKSCRLRSLAGCSPWGHKELDTTECMCVHVRTHTHLHTTFSCILTWQKGEREDRLLSGVFSYSLIHGYSILMT